MTRQTNHTFLYTHLMRWEPLILPGGEGNAWVKTLAKDNETGARSLLVRFDRGYKQKKTLSEWPADIYVLEGSMTSGDRSYQAGTYHYRPGGSAFGPISSPEGITRLIFTSDIKTQNSAKEEFVQNVNDMPWAPSYADPTRDTRRKGVKMLREDKDARIAVLIHGHFVPGQDMPGEKHYHHHHEEAFTLLGDNEDYLDDVDGHMMWMPGAYVCREIGGSAHGDVIKKSAPQMQIIRRAWLGDTENFWSATDNIRSKVSPVVEFAE